MSNFVILPLFSPRYMRNPRIALRSGLNHWNADGRRRNQDEAYIPVPAFIQNNYPDFFPGLNTFSLYLPDRTLLDVKICQQGAKALMSDPNSDLGYWILRSVLGLQGWQLATYQDLLDHETDSVKIEKIGEVYFITLEQVGAYHKFCNYQR